MVGDALQAVLQALWVVKLMYSPPESDASSEAVFCLGALMKVEFPAAAIEARVFV